MSKVKILLIIMLVLFLFVGCVEKQKVVQFKNNIDYFGEVKVLVGTKNYEPKTLMLPFHILYDEKKSELVAVTDSEHTVTLPSGETIEIQTQCISDSFKAEDKKIKTKLMWKSQQKLTDGNVNNESGKYSLEIKITEMDDKHIKAEYLVNGKEINKNGFELKVKESKK